MSAQVDTMYSVREVPWHKQGQVLAEYPGSWAEAREQAGIDWDVLAEEPKYLDGIDGDGFPIYVTDSEYRRVYRSDTRRTLGYTSDTYEVIDHEAMGGIIEAVLAQTNVKYETAGSLDEGRAVWCLARLDEPITLPGDPNTVTYPYLAITNRHDGMGSCALRATAIRIVCMNTFRAAEMEGERTKATFTFRHTKNWKDRVTEAREAVTGARREIADYIELATDLLGMPVTTAQQEQFVRLFIGTPPEALVSKRVANNIETSRGLMRKILASETTASVAHTAYGLVQAGVEYADHVRRAKSWESKLNRTLLQPEPLKRRALVLAREVVKTG